MSIPVPDYLKNLAKIAKQSSSHIHMDLICECGVSDFIVYQNKRSQEDEKKRQEWEQKLSKWGSGESYIDKTDGKRYLVRRNFFGKIVEKYSIEEIPKINNHQVIKIKCDKCGQEYLIFDNKKYGYDALIEKQNAEEILLELTQKKFRSSKKNLLRIAIKIFNDESLEKFIERTGENINHKQYSNAFSDITIYGYIVDLDNKKIILYQEETA